MNHELPAGAFDALAPQHVLTIVEQISGERLNGVVTPYASYVNRVYGLQTDDGRRLVAKFYRPGRWDLAAIEDEHELLADLAAAEVPVVAPLIDDEGDTLAVAELEAAGGELLDVPVALFPHRGGRSFDADTDEDWFRLGAIVGRMHAVAAGGTAPARRHLNADWTRGYLSYLEQEQVIHPEIAPEFTGLCRRMMDELEPMLSGVETLRIHGDCHRGNILDRVDEGLLLIDFDDMMTGPAVQDLWLLLPDRVEACRREITMLLDGYGDFRAFDRRELRLVEPLRLMRMIHFLAWRARQRHDNWFRRQEPEWGNHAFWVRELEDLREQVRVIRSDA